MKTFARGSSPIRPQSPALRLATRHEARRPFGRPPAGGERMPGDDA